MTDIKKKLIVIIPAYEPPTEFVDYAREVSSLAMHLVVVNDGSGEKYDGVFDAIRALPNTTVLDYGENHGKGYALKYAYQHCIDSFSPESIIVTADCDGQHKVKDIVNVYKAAFLHPTSLILGSRNFDLANVPARSRAGNVNMRRMFRFFYGVSLYDTQTGLRGFTVELAKSFVKVKGDRFEYELGQLIWCKKNRVTIHETPIDTVYPDNPEEHVSHFRTIRDSARVLGVMLSNLGWYLCSSVLSAVVDVGLFYILSTFVFPDVNWLYTLLATLGARVASSVVNFAFNYKFVFDGAGKSAVIRYYILWACQLATSYGIAALLSEGFLLTGIWLALLKGAGDLILAIFSYQIQQHWVFRRKNPEKFWTPFLRFCQAVARFFSKKYRSDVLPDEDGAVYVCRHRDMHGPYTTLKWLKFNVHPMILSVFFGHKNAYKQFSEYTFSVRVGKPVKRFDMRAWLSAHLINIGINGVKAIPVYRGTMQAVKTLRKSIDCLKAGESIIVYPDIDYVGDGSGGEGIYEGFIHLGELYHRTTGKSLKFIPLYIDDNEKRIVSYDAVTCDSFKENGAEVKEYLTCAINGRPYDSSYLPPSMMLGRGE